jgi:hypothetical protein
MTPDEHAAQRDAVRLSELMQTSRSDRRDMPRRKPLVVVVPVPPHVFVIPTVVENERPL